ncbi:MAG TPA: site-specific integrase, partial [Labilithrix sp.]
MNVRQYTKSKRVGFEVDIRFEWPDGTPFRQRLRAPVSTKSQAMACGRAREVEILGAGKDCDLARSRRDKPTSIEKEVPTLETFAERFIEGYARANQQKASTVDTKKRILKNHLIPLLGSKRLDEITNEDIQRVKGHLAHRKRKTVNNVINVLSKLLNVAVEWGVIPHRACTIKLMKVDQATPAFYDFDEYERLVEAARKIDRGILVTVLLGGDAGLRRGEILALRWSDVDLRRQQLKIERAIWEGVEDVPKGGRGRIVPMTQALAAVLGAHRHMRGPRVLCFDDGKPLDANVLQDWIERATRRANLEPTRSLHILRHTFCSHLAMRGAPAKAIQELAGHQSLSMTLRYMHLTPSARDAAIRLL